MNRKVSIWRKIVLIAVILFSAMGSANAEPNVTINISGTPIVGESTIDIINVNFTDFNKSDTYYITVFNDTNGNLTLDNNDQIENYQTGLLEGGTEQIIPVNWTPQSTGLHWVDALGASRSSRRGVFVSDTKEIYPVPELATLILTSAGILGLIGLTRMRRKD